MVFTLNTKITLRIPKRTDISAVPVAGDSAHISAMKSNDDDHMNKFELEVMMEVDDNHASNGEDGLARCAHKQAAGMLEVYEEDGQQLPGDGDYQSDGDENELTKAMGGKKHMRKVVRDTNYTFCPIPHRLSILRMMCKHFCQHPILPEWHGEACNPGQIHHDAVLESYYHCKANNLCEVWAYLWVNWYTTEK